METLSTDRLEAERIAAIRNANVRDPEEFRPGSYGCHEALHAASMLTDMVESHLLKHPAILLNDDLCRHTHAIHAAQFDLYQAIGEKHLSDQAVVPTDTL
ncbi:hypothetical protein [Shinella sp.]|uniref:hypothetical protein n=1 Tax=Shinella sp. TaxID=1870904 RepID=UPI0029B4D871|nr:hypothetical protein [Shinella sp.]MDX3976576.1 hypothetical protein [Shinella sp.]